MILDIVTYPAASLKEKCVPVTEITDEIRQLAADMLETMYEAPGVGLAAPQVGRNIRMLVMDPAAQDEEKQPRVVINPELTLSEDTVLSRQEGCLSVPLNYRADVQRAERVHLRYMDLDGKIVEENLEGFPAIVIQHEADHLDGTLFIDRIGYGLGVGDHALVSQYHMDLYFESAAMILALITLGKYLETRSKGKTSEAITKLMDLAPKTAAVERGGVETVIPVEEVVVGDTVLVRPGQSVPVDGVILEGNTSIDEAAITGESIPVEKEPGSTVIAATINKAGFFKFRATKVGADTTLAQIIRLVEDASSSKAPIAKLADKISGVFVPVVIGIALAASIGWLLAGQTPEFAVSIGISVLVISCPCALGLATPVAIMVGTGKGAENGILIKSGEALETAHSINAIVLDKTGMNNKEVGIMADILGINGITGTFTERQEIHRIQQVRFPHAVLSEKAVQLGRE